MKIITIVSAIFISLFGGTGEAGNIVFEIGAPPKEFYVGDMIPGEVGYVVPWAASQGNLNTKFTIHPKSHGTATLKVECVAPGKYKLDWKLVK